MNEKAALVCTLGTEPQVLTLSLSHLLAQGIPIVEAVGLYSRSSDPTLRAAVDTLRSSWGGLPFGNTVQLKLDEIPIRDLDSPAALKTAYRVIRKRISAYKTLGWSVHFNIAGGRKPLALCAFIVAQFLFSSHDHLWYLISSPALVRSRRLLGNLDEYRLIELPVPRWSETGPLLAALSRYDDPWIVSAIQRKLIRQEERHRWELFFNAVLTSAERRVVRELVLHGGTNHEIASRLRKSPRTVGHQLSSVFRKLRGFLDFPAVGSIDRTALVALLAPYFREDGLYEMSGSSDDGG